MDLNKVRNIGIILLIKTSPEDPSPSGRQRLMCLKVILPGLAIGLLLPLSGCRDCTVFEPLAPEKTTAAAALLEDHTLHQASMGGKYETLLLKIECPEDKDDFGEFKDWGEWSGSSWHQYTNLPSGYWVYVYPHWYVWQTKK